ncbi:MAG TPA: SRPBCC family protein [Actinomycetota bacterium]|nr:SRPBCC family protein [Actinomycetota bacterium]
MIIDNEFSIPAPIDQVWKYMNDYHRVARCMPGAEIQSANDKQVKGRVKVSMGPLKLAFGGVIDIMEKNEGAHRVVMKATGSEEKGKGQASATVTSTMFSAGGGTTVKLSQDLQMTGAIAQYGRGMMADVIGALMKQFAACAAAEIKRPGGGAGAARGGSAAKSMSGFSLMLLSLKAFFKNIFSSKSSKK